jgi:hypothetical protein
MAYLPPDIIDNDGAKLVEVITRDLYAQKCDEVYQHIYDSYTDATHSVYAA